MTLLISLKLHVNVEDMLFEFIYLFIFYVWFFFAKIIGGPVLNYKTFTELKSLLHLVKALKCFEKSSQTLFYLQTGYAGQFSF